MKPGIRVIPDFAKTHKNHIFVEQYRKDPNFAHGTDKCYVTVILSAMQSTKTPQEEILALEAEISYHKKLLDKSITDEDVLEKTKVIFHDLKTLYDQLAELKKSLVNKA